MQKLSVIYMKQSFAFVQLGSSCICLPVGPRSIVLELELCMPALVPSPFFSFLQKVSGQQILEICCSHPCFKEISNSKDSFSMDPKMLAIILFHLYINIFSERDLFWKYFLKVLFTIFFKKCSHKAEIKLHKHNKEVFWQYTHYEPWKVICTSLWCHAIFIEVHPGPCFISDMNLAWGLSNRFWKFLCRG